MNRQNLNNSKNFSLGIVSSFDELCGNATYSDALAKEFSSFFNVKRIRLKTNVSISNGGFKTLPKQADKHISELASELKSLDSVNIQFEYGLLGNTNRQVLSRTKKLIDSSKFLFFTMHRIDTPIDYISSLQTLCYTRSFFKALKTLKGSYISKAYKKIINHILKRKSNSYQFIVHTKREEEILKQVFHVPDKNIICHPIVFFDTKKRKSLISSKEDNLRNLKIKYRIKDDKKIIGFFGFISEYKGLDTVIQSLETLSDKYVLLVCGGNHPASINSDYSNKYLNYCLKLAKKHISMDGTENVIFAGPLNDKDFFSTMACVDYIVLPYHEVGQSASGVASLALELENKSLFSRNACFNELGKIFPKSFETFDIGNHLELSQKIKMIESNKIKYDYSSVSKYTPITLAKAMLSKYSSR